MRFEEVLLGPDGGGRRRETEARLEVEEGPVGGREEEEVGGNVRASNATGAARGKEVTEGGISWG